MSTVKANSHQVGQSATATNNFTFYQPSTPDGTVRLGVGNSGATTADVITATSAGNVGIGTSSPAYKLDVNGGINSQAGFVYLGNANVYANYRSGNNDVIYSGASGFFYYQNITSTYHAWYTGNSERARIDSSGNLLVGTTSINPGLGNNNIGCMFAGGGYGSVSRADTAWYVNYTGAGTGQNVHLKWQGTTVGNISTTSTATAYNTSSDYRLKENVQPMTGALARVSALKPVTYKWKSDGSDGEGFIAHELQEIIPQAVTGEKDEVDSNGSPRYQGIDTSFLVATLTAAIQELKAEVDALKAQLAG